MQEKIICQLFTNPASRHNAASEQNGVDIFLRDNKSGGFICLRYLNVILLFCFGRERRFLVG